MLMLTFFTLLFHIIFHMVGPTQKMISACLDMIFFNGDASSECSLKSIYVENNLKSLNLYAH